MPKIQEDFSAISSSFEALPDDDYRFEIESIEDQEKKEGKNTALIVTSVVKEGPLTGRKFFDYVYLAKNDGTKNSFGLGRIKAYAEAILGKEKANDPSGIDTDELKGGVFLGVIKSKMEEYNGEERLRSELKKVLPVG